MATEHGDDRNEPKLIRACVTHPLIKFEAEDEYALSPEEIAQAVPLIRATKSHPLIVLEAEDGFAIEPKGPAPAAAPLDQPSASDLPNL